MIVREPLQLVRQALLAALLQTANDRARSKLKAQHCIWSLPVCLISLSERRHPASLGPHPRSPTYLHALIISVHLQSFYWRNYNQCVGSSQQEYVIVEMFALGNRQCCLHLKRGHCTGLLSLLVLGHSLSCTLGSQVISLSKWLESGEEAINE